MDLVLGKGESFVSNSFQLKLPSSCFSRISDYILVMGSFNSTCCLSNLPISYGDEVKYLLLTENPYQKNLVCYSTDMWFPRTWPIRAFYNDYGSIEDFDETSPAVYAVTEGLKHDLIEVGMGDNSCHDVPAKKGMSFKDTLEAVWEKRIAVQSDYTFKLPHSSRLIDELSADASQDARNLLSKLESLSKPPQPVEPEPEPGLPTLQLIEKILLSAGYQVQKNERNSYLVDERDSGWVRVRCGYYEDRAEGLEKILPLFNDFAAMITTGTGNYGYGPEIQIFPKYNPKKTYHLLAEKEEKQVCYVYQAMILKEVWDALISEMADGCYQVTRQKLQKEWDAAIHDGHFFGFGRSMVRSSVPFTMGLEEHTELVAAQHAKQPFSEQQISDFLDDAAGLLCLQGPLYNLRYWWRPSFSCGPQYGDLDAQKKFYLAMAEICERKRAEEE